MPARTFRSGSVLRVVVWGLVAVAVIVFAVYQVGVLRGQGVVRVALITADSDPYWDAVLRGAEAAAQEYDVELSVYRADGSVDNQSRTIMQAAGENPDGIAVSPVDPAQQALALRQISQDTLLVTVDSDCLTSNRLCFVGANNYAAGRRCAELVKQALPDGAKVVVTMGPMKKANGHDRRQGIIDELMSLSFGPGRPTYPMDEPHGDGSYQLVATYIDDIDPEQARANVLRALEEHPDLDCIVGIYAYGVPSALSALAEVGRSDVVVVGFDDRDETLLAIEDGRAYGTIAQDQYYYGYQSVALLARAARREGMNVVPLTSTIFVEPRVVTRESLAEFRASRAEQQAGADSATSPEASP